MDINVEKTVEEFIIKGMTRLMLEEGFDCIGLFYSKTMTDETLQQILLRHIKENQEWEQFFSDNDLMTWEPNA